MERLFYYADDLVLVSSTASGMNELLGVCEQFSENFGLKFNEQKTVLLYLMPEKLKIKPGTSVMMNDTVIKMESACRYLGHMITDDLDDNEDIKRQLRSFYGKANMLLRTFNYCSADVKKNCFPLIVVVCILATCGAITLYGNTGKCMLHIIMFSGD